MFDARSILDVLVRGGAPQGPGQGQGQQGGLDAFRDLLGQLAGGDRPPSGQPAPMPRGRVPEDDDRSTPYSRGPRRDEDQDLGQPQMPRGSREQYDPRDASGGGSLEDLLRSVLGGGQGGPGGAGSLQDILRDFLGGAQGAGGGMSRLQGEGGQGQGVQGQGGQGSVLDVLKQVLGQATSGVREGAGRLDEMTGASGRAREALTEATGQSPDELVAKLREWVANNQLGAGAALGGLGALILGTGSGRSLAASAAKLGGLALIGGLAYKAYQNYQQGQPPLTGGRAPSQQTLLAAPQGSGFEPGAVTQETATRYIRAMIAAASADGRIDAREQDKILGGLKQAGIEQEAREFLTREINNPATVEGLAAGISSPQEAVQVYTAARISIDLDTEEEHAFLAELAEALDLDDDLVTQVDAAARSAAA
jgi:uncharacterized membrane protein YebE (DUF533 family)